MLSDCLCNDGLCEDCNQTMWEYNKMKEAIRKISLTVKKYPNRSREGSIAVELIDEISWSRPWEED